MLEIPQRIWKKIAGYTKPQKVFRTNHEHILCWKTTRRTDKKYVVIKLFEWDIIEESKKELKAVADLRRVNIPNLVKIYDIKEDDDLGVYYVMEYWGEDLRETIRTPPRQDWVIEAIKQLLQIIAELHRHKRVHRDIKPENIFIKEHQVKLGDYGLIKSQRVITQLATIAGTRDYMAPEILKGNPSRLGRDPAVASYDKRCDIYSAGIVLLELLTSVREISTQKPNDISEPLWEVILKATAKEPDKRFATAGTFIKAIDTLSQPSPVKGEENLSQSSPLSRMKKPKMVSLRDPEAVLPGSLHSGVGKNRDEGVERKSLEPISQNLDIQRRITEPPQSVGLLIKTLKTQFDQFLKSGTVSEAIKVGKELARAVRDQLGPNEPYLAVVWNKLADLYCQQKNYKKAELLYRGAMGIDQRTYDKDSLEVILDLSCLGELCLKKDDYLKAREFYQQARMVIDGVCTRPVPQQPILEQDSWPLHVKLKPAMAIIFNQLGVADYFLGEYNTALRCYENALDINEKHYEKQHESVAINLYNLGLTYEAQGNKSAAQPLYRQAREILGKPLFGKGHVAEAIRIEGLLEDIKRRLE